VKQRLSRWLSSLTAKYIAVFVLLVLGSVAATAAYLLYSSYETNKNSLLELQRERATTVAALVTQFLNSEGEKLRSLGPPQYLTDHQLKARFALSSARPPTRRASPTTLRKDGCGRSREPRPRRRSSAAGSSMHAEYSLAPSGAPADFPSARSSTAGSLA